MGNGVVMYGLFDCSYQPGEECEELVCVSYDLRSLTKEYTRLGDNDKTLVCDDGCHIGYEWDAISHYYIKPIKFV